jgi:hypothetical protein
MMFMIGIALGAALVTIGATLGAKLFRYAP